MQSKHLHNILYYIPNIVADTINQRGLYCSHNMSYSHPTLFIFGRKSYLCIDHKS